ncbi:hypothetical protein PMG11_11059 [Penicillium brasilianum]|uniref:Uncharacterized protein n=1 Tax=Penicillium brasilianum TaxID=104259 RepID=A0A0F7U577_PENBI|nr:hypothetical protein PMG11_11059 [Penicillium brasilianum]
MYLLVLLASLLLSHFTVSALNVSSTELVEQLFLDFSVEEISLNNTDGFAIVEPWASEYLNAIRDGRFGDAVWARYHIAGDVHSRTGLIEGTNLTVLESIREDALGYRSGDQDLYAEAVELYEKTNRTDGHKNIIRMLKKIGDQDIDEVQAELNKRTTWSIKCSTN